MNIEDFVYLPTIRYSVISNKAFTSLLNFYSWTRLGIEFSLPLVEEKRKSKEQQNPRVHPEEEEQKEKAQE